MQLVRLCNGTHELELSVMPTGEVFAAPTAEHLQCHCILSVSKLATQRLLTCTVCLCFFASLQRGLAVLLLCCDYGTLISHMLFSKP